MVKIAYPVATPDISADFMGLQGSCFEDNLKLIADSGYDAVELFLRNSENVPENFLSLLSKYKLQVACLGTTFTAKTDGLFLSTSDDDVLQRAIDRINSLADFASSCNCECISIGKARGMRKDNPNAERQQIRAFRTVCDYSKKKNVKILIEPQNIDQIDNVNSVADGLDFIKKTGSDNLYLHLDTLHLSKTESSLLKGFSDAGSLTKFIHISDSSRMIPGCGSIDFSGLFGFLKNLNYNGFISPEIKQTNGCLTVSDAYSAIRNLEKKEMKTSGGNNG